MSLTQDDFKIPQSQLDELNSAIEHAVSQYFTKNPDQDPIDGMSVTFSFAFGFGRTIDVSVAGKTISMELD